MSVSSWAEKYCSQTSELVMLYQPEQGYLCQSQGLNRVLSRRGESMLDFLNALPPEQYHRPNFDSFSLYLENVVCIENSYLYRFSQLNATQDSWKNFADTMANLHNIMFRLSHADSLDEIYQQAILEAQQHLFIDRLAIFLLDSDKNIMQGTWGTDQEGNIKNEKEFSCPIPDAPWVELTLASREHVEVWDNVDLLYYNKVVGKGWNAMAAMWDGETAIGWIACDNLIKKRSIQPWLKEIIGQFGQALGHTIVRFKNLKKLKDVNDNLEFLVAQRSTQLSDKVKLLERTQDELIESEKLASLGGLVAGVAHEVNTPIGIGVTAASHLVQETQNINNIYLDKKIKKSQLEDYFHCATESSEIILDNLARASDLIKSFKQLAVDQSMHASFDINMRELVNNIQKSFRHQFRNKPIAFINHIDESLNFYGCPGTINQILTNLVSNSLSHGFESGHQGNIEIKASIEPPFFHLCYFDTGTGVQHNVLNKLFEPFFTTKRGQGGTGLGLNIVYNIIKKLDGKIELSHVKPTGLQCDIMLPLEVNQ